MLPREHRMTDGRDFRAAVRGGRRAGTSTLVVHVTRSGDGSARVGFVVGKGVGNAVVRNRVKRRLRHLVAGHLDALAPGTSLVVRALAPSADRPGPVLSDDLSRALARADALVTS